MTLSQHSLQNVGLRHSVARLALTEHISHREQRKISVNQITNGRKARLHHHHRHHHHPRISWRHKSQTKLQGRRLGLPPKYQQRRSGRGPFHACAAATVNHSVAREHRNHPAGLARCSARYWQRRLPFALVTYGAVKVVLTGCVFLRLTVYSISFLLSQFSP